MQQNIGAVHPMDVGLHRVKPMGGNILKTQVLLDIFMKNFHCPAESISQHDLACRHSQIITGKVLGGDPPVVFKF